MNKPLYTTRGDNGTTSVFGSNVRLSKSHTLFEALGTLDECGAFLGLARASISYDPLVHRVLHDLQNGLFTIQAEVAGSPTRLAAHALTELESSIASIESYIKNPHGFVVAGATKDAALLDITRTVARRAERAVLRVKSIHLSTTARAYLNRVSSALYALARYVVERVNIEEEHPHYRTHA